MKLCLLFLPLKHILKQCSGCKCNISEGYLNAKTYKKPYLRTFNLIGTLYIYFMYFCRITPNELGAAKPQMTLTQLGKSHAFGNLKNEKKLSVIERKQCGRAEVAHFPALRMGWL